MRRKQILEVVLEIQMGMVVDTLLLLLLHLFGGDDSEPQTLMLSLVSSLDGDRKDAGDVDDDLETRICCFSTYPSYFLLWNQRKHRPNQGCYYLSSWMSWNW